MNAATRGLVWAIFLAAASSAAKPSLVRGQRPEAFVVGVVSADSLLPIARYERGRWLNTWPGPEDPVGVPPLSEVPTTWLGRPVPRGWTLWHTGGGSVPIEVNGTKPGEGCVASVTLALATTHDPPAGAIDDVHDGLAVNTERPVVALERVAIESAPQAVTSAIVAEAGRSQRGVAARRLFRSHTPSPTYYFEAARPDVQLGGDRRPTVVRGWVRLDAARPVVIGPATMPCGNELSDTMSCLVPLGILSFRDRAVWVMEHPQGETTSFELWEVTDRGARKVAKADGPGC